MKIVNTMHTIPGAARESHEKQLRESMTLF
jgi:hypothetical protein